MIVLSALSTKSLLSWGITSNASGIERSMLQYNQKAAEKTASLDDFDVQQTNPKAYATYLASSGPTAKHEY